MEKQKEPNNVRILKKRKPTFPLKRPFDSKNKIHLGSIPVRHENILLTEPETKSSLKGFISHSERAYSFVGVKKVPGVGEYNFIDKWSSNLENPSFSKAGYLSGFISNNDRFQGFGSFLTKNETPIATYNPDKIFTINYKIKNSLIGKSLYNTKKSHSLKQNNIAPEPLYYDPKKYDDWMFTNKNYRYTFDSSPGRPVIKNERDFYPGPCDYFRDLGNKNSVNKEKKIVLESITDKKLKNEKKLKDLSIKTEQSKDDMYFLLKDRKGKIITNEASLLNDLERSKLEPNKIVNQNYKNFLDKIKDKEGKTSLIKFKIEEEKELNYIKSLIGNDNGKTDLFYLSPPRWKENKYNLKVPGPAYYSPKYSKQKFSYNRTNEFICPNGPEF